MANPASIGFPQVTLETPRLVLRAFEPGDLPDVAVAGADELTQRWLPLPRPYTVEEARAWCLVTVPAMREAGTGVHCAVVDRAAGRVCGGIGLNRTDWAALVTEVSYWVGPWARGRGHAPEALRAVADWVLRDQGFERLELRAATGNLASQRVAEKAGFTREGVLRNAAPSTQDGWTWSSSRSCGAIRRPGSRASGPSPPAGGDHVAASLCGLAFMDAATPAAGPRVLAGDRDLGFVLMEDLGSGPSLERLTATEHTWDEQGVVVQASRPDAQVTATLRAIGIRLDNPVLRVTRVAVV